MQNSSQEKQEIVSLQQKNINNLHFVYMNENILQENKELIHFCPENKAASEKSAVCIDLSCMRASFAPGVSEVNQMVGFTDEQMQANIGQAVQARLDDLVVITEYNPAIEKFKTGNMILNMF